MRIKKGFTLAEVLIVLMVIGAIATMTIPSLMKGVTEAQYKTAYKKAYNAIVNLCAMEKANGNLPVTITNDDRARFYQTLINSLSIKAYVKTDGENGDEGKVYGVASYKTAVKVHDGLLNADVSYGDTSNEANYADTYNGTSYSPWIVTEDNIAYRINPGNNNSRTDVCKKKQVLNGDTNTVSNMASQSCVLMVVDVNGLSTGPNLQEEQSTSGVKDKSLDQLTGDRYYIFIGYDGATTGNPSVTAEGRIVGNMK